MAIALDCSGNLFQDYIRQSPVLVNDLFMSSQCHYVFFDHFLSHLDVTFIDDWAGVSVTDNCGKQPGYWVEFGVQCFKCSCVRKHQFHQISWSFHLPSDSVFLSVSKSNWIGWILKSNWIGWRQSFITQCEFIGMSREVNRSVPCAGFDCTPTPHFLSSVCVCVWGGGGGGWGG